jgi:hypothetical protein
MGLQVALSIVCDVTKEGDVQHLSAKTKELLDQNQWKLWGGLFDNSSSSHVPFESLIMPALEMEEELIGFQLLLLTKSWMSTFMEL